MTGQERRHIVQMVASGKITAEQATNLMRELDAPPVTEVSVKEKGGQRGSGSPFEGLRKKARQLAALPLWLGVGTIVAATVGIYAVQQADGYSFWFFCLWVPFFFGVGLVTLGARTTRWLYLNVDRSRASEGPRRVALALPVPLGLASWFLRNFGQHIRGLKRTAVDEVVQALAKLRGVNEPLIVDVDEEEDGEHVQIYIG